MEEIGLLGLPNEILNEIALLSNVDEVSSLPLLFVNPRLTKIVKREKLLPEELAIICVKHGYLSLFQWVSEVFPLDSDRFVEYLCDRPPPEDVLLKPPTALYPYLAAQALIHGKTSMYYWIIVQYKLDITHLDTFWSAFGEADLPTVLGTFPTIREEVLSTLAHDDNSITYRWKRIYCISLLRAGNFEVLNYLGENKDYARRLRFLFANKYYLSVADSVGAFRFLLETLKVDFHIEFFANSIRRGNLEALTFAYSRIPQSWNVHAVFPRAVEMAVESGHIEKVEFLLEKGFTYNPERLLDAAVISGNLDMVKYVMDKGCNTCSPRRIMVLALNFPDKDYWEFCLNILQGRLVPMCYVKAIELFRKDLGFNLRLVKEAWAWLQSKGCLPQLDYIFTQTLNFPHAAILAFFATEFGIPIKDDEMGSIFRNASLYAIRKVVFELRPDYLLLEKDFTSLRSRVDANTLDRQRVFKFMQSIDRSRRKESEFFKETIHLPEVDEEEDGSDGDGDESANNDEGHDDRSHESTPPPPFHLLHHSILPSSNLLPTFPSLFPSFSFIYTPFYFLFPHSFMRFGHHILEGSRNLRESYPHLSYC